LLENHSDPVNYNAYPSHPKHVTAIPFILFEMKSLIDIKASATWRWRWFGNYCAEAVIGFADRSGYGQTVIARMQIAFLVIDLDWISRPTCDMVVSQ
jgi:hypothetical protein